KLFGTPAKNRPSVPPRSTPAGWLKILSATRISPDETIRAAPIALVSPSFVSTTFSYTFVCPGASVSENDVEARSAAAEALERATGFDAVAFDCPCFRKWNVKVSGACVRFVAQTVE